MVEEHGSERFTAALVPMPNGRSMRRAGRHDREVDVVVDRDGKPYQRFVIVVDRRLLRSIDADEDETTARAMVMVMESAIKQRFADGSVPAPTEIELRLTDERALAAAVRSMKAD